jgi:hypothetical protein
VVIRALRLLLLLDGGDDAPRGTTGADHVLVRDREQVTLIDGKLAPDLQQQCQSQIRPGRQG